MLLKYNFSMNFQCIKTTLYITQSTTTQYEKTIQLNYEIRTLTPSSNQITLNCKIDFLAKHWGINDLTPNNEYDEDPQRLTSRFPFSLATISIVTLLVNLIYSTNSIAIQNNEEKYGIQDKTERQEMPNRLKGSRWLEGVNSL